MRSFLTSRGTREEDQARRYTAPRRAHQRGRNDVPRVDRRTSGPRRGPQWTAWPLSPPQTERVDRRQRRRAAEKGSSGRPRDRLLAGPDAPPAPRLRPGRKRRLMRDYSAAHAEPDGPLRSFPRTAAVTLGDPEGPRSCSAVPHAASLPGSPVHRPGNTAAPRSPHWPGRRTRRTAVRALP